MQGEALLRDLLAIHVVAHLNEALCLNYRKMCPASTVLSEQCDQVMTILSASALSDSVSASRSCLPP